MNTSSTCSICLEKCKSPALLKLYCNCKYTVHYRCYKKWWKDSKTCIICHKKAGPPMPYSKRKYYTRKRLSPKTIITELNNQIEIANDVDLTNLVINYMSENINYTHFYYNYIRRNNHRHSYLLDTPIKYLFIQLLLCIFVVWWLVKFHGWPN